MPHTSMINITFGVERRDLVLKQQKQSTSAAVASHQQPAVFHNRTPRSNSQQTVVFHNRTSRPAANTNGQQQQQLPGYKLLQRAQPLKNSSPGHQEAAQHSRVTRTTQETAVSPKGIVIVPVLNVSFTITCILNGHGQKERSWNMWMTAKVLMHLHSI